MFQMYKILFEANWTYHLTVIVIIYYSDGV